jgi:hypothetical protein
MMTIWANKTADVMMASTPLIFLNMVFTSFGGMLPTIVSFLSYFTSSSFFDILAICYPHIIT